MPRISLETRRLLLRNTQASDIPELVRMWTDPEVTRFMGGPRDAIQLEKTFAEDVHNPDPWLYDQWPVIEKSSGELIGYCGLLDKEVDGRPEIELVYVFVPSAWGRGYATEIALGLREHAVQKMGLRRLIALIEPANMGSARVAERAGFHLERKVTRPGGERELYVFQAPTTDRR
jgi:RimJ/RimL family protein N-acetyltransferase